jgi:hypothetical protein
VNELVALLAKRCPELDLADTNAVTVQAGLSAPRTEATIVYRPNREEIARRRAVGLTAVTRLDQLDRMMELPAGLPVPYPSLKAVDRRAIQRFPSGCVEYRVAGVVRLLTAPLDVKLAIAVRSRFPAGLVQAGRFAPFCARALALTGTPRNLRDAAIEADFWGIGLIIKAASTPELVVAPTLFERRRHTPAGWAFAEDIYRQAMQQAAV